MKQRGLIVLLFHFVISSCSGVTTCDGKPLALKSAWQADRKYLRTWKLVRKGSSRMHHEFLPVIDD